MCQSTNLQNRVGMDDRRSDRAVLGEHGLVYGERTSGGPGDICVPRQAAEEDGEGVCVWQLRTLLHLRQRSILNTGRKMDEVRAYLVVQLDSVVYSRFTHLIVNDMIPTDSTLDISASQPDKVECFHVIIFP